MDIVSDYGKQLAAAEGCVLPAPKPAHPCPSCGYCPTCGRGLWHPWRHDYWWYNTPPIWYSNALGSHP